MELNNLAKSFIAQLESIIVEFQGYKSKAKYDDLSDVVDNVKVQTLITQSRASVTRISGKDSIYSRQIEEILARPIENDWGKMAMIIGVVSALQADIRLGYLASLEEIVHGELFADFLEMAKYLQDEGYKDAAAVIAGGTIEAQLRQLCIKNAIAIEIVTSKSTEPKKADQLNADLAKEKVYSKLDQKNITAWLDLRNKAAHGRYSEYTKEQVDLLITGIRDFITRVPA